MASATINGKPAKVLILPEGMHPDVISAYHESGHALIAHEHGYPIEGISIVRQGDMAGYLKGGKCTAAGEKKFRYDGMMSMAGMIAEEILQRKKILSLSGIDAAHYNRIKRIKGDDFLTDCYYNAQKIIRRNWHKVQRLASVLAQKKVLDAKEIKELLS